LNDIVPGIQKTAGLVEEINGSSNEQADGINQVTKAIHQLDQVIQQSSVSTEEMSSAAEVLSEQAEQLLASAAFFHVEGRQQEARASSSRQETRSARAPSPRPAPSRAPLLHTPPRAKGNSKSGIKVSLASAADDIDDNDFERV